MNISVAFLLCRVTKAIVICRDGSFYLHVTVESPEATAALPVDLIGIDLGVANIAFDSDGNRYSGTHVNKVRHRHHALRSKLQKKGTKSAKRLLKKRCSRRAEVRHQRKPHNF